MTRIIIVKNSIFSGSFNVVVEEISGEEISAKTFHSKEEIIQEIERLLYMEFKSEIKIER